MWAFPPARVISLLVRSSSASLREQSMTEAPASASPRAIAAPRPLPEPVTIATRPDKSNNEHGLVFAIRSPLLRIPFYSIHQCLAHSMDHALDIRDKHQLAR